VAHTTCDWGSSSLERAPIDVGAEISSEAGAAEDADSGSAKDADIFAERPGAQVLPVVDFHTCRGGVGTTLDLPQARDAGSHLRSKS
jgi:hypothetical protein